MPSMNEAARAWGVTYQRAAQIAKRHSAKLKRGGPGGRNVEISEAEIARIRRIREREGTQPVAK